MSRRVRLILVAFSICLAFAFAVLVAVGFATANAAPDSAPSLSAIAASSVAQTPPGLGADQPSTAGVGKGPAVSEPPAPMALAVAVQAGPVWFHPVPGVCRGHGGGGDFGAPRSGYLHQGIDLGAGYGTPIHAVGGGVIISAGYHGSAGNQIQERIGNTVWKYNHLSSFRRTGGFVYPNEVIGYVGATGRATGAHLHIELWLDGWNNVNPADWLWGAGVRGMYC